MSVDTHANKLWGALQRHSRVLVQVGSRALRDVRRTANKSATSAPHTWRSTWNKLIDPFVRTGARNRSEYPRDRPSVSSARVEASATRTQSLGPPRVSTWKTVMLAVLSVMFVISLVYTLSLRAGMWSERSSSASTAQTIPPRTAATPLDVNRSDAARDATPRANVQPALSEVTEAACYAGLSDGGVAFQKVSKSDAPGVAWPIKLTSAVDGVLIHGGKSDAPTNYLDCRLALALLAWAPSLREQGVVGLEHYSAYRRDAVVAGTASPSGHAIGSAIDIGRFEMRDGRKLSVLEDWTNRDRGADPCEWWPTDSDAARIMRKLVCDAYRAELFQSVITPHYNDAHQNHVHLEIAPKSEGAWIG